MYGSSYRFRFKFRSRSCNVGEHQKETHSSCVSWVWLQLLLVSAPFDPVLNLNPTVDSTMHLETGHCQSNMS